MVWIQSIHASGLTLFEVIIGIISCCIFSYKEKADTVGFCFVLSKERIAARLGKQKLPDENIFLSVSCDFKPKSIGGRG